MKYKIYQLVCCFLCFEYNYLAFDGAKVFVCGFIMCMICGVILEFTKTEIDKITKTGEENARV